MKKLIPAPIDNKNLLEDAFEDNEFQGFYVGNGNSQVRRHLIGTVETENYKAIVSASWRYGDFRIAIEMVGIQPSEEYDLVRDEVFDYYDKAFKTLQCDDNPDLVVKTDKKHDILTVSFYFEVDE